MTNVTPLRSKSETSAQAIARQETELRAKSRLGADAPAGVDVEVDAGFDAVVRGEREALGLGPLYSLTVEFSGEGASDGLSISVSED